MIEGLIIRAYNSFYYVQTNSGLIECKLRGRFKKERFILTVGDKVKLTLLNDASGIIEEILPRHSLLHRPPVANVDQVVITFALTNPAIKFSLLDRFLLLAEASSLDIIICINKIDLGDENLIEQIKQIYTPIGYKLIFTSAYNSTGTNELKNELKNKITVFAGPSGVGKSSLLNNIEAGLALQIGEVSKKIGRGKHTTRYAQLIPLLNGGYVVDTPGFSNTEFDFITKEQLPYLFPDFIPYQENCKFNTCMHDKEPSCMVKDAVSKGLINKSRYDTYMELREELQTRKDF